MIINQLNELINKAGSSGIKIKEIGVDASTWNTVVALARYSTNGEIGKELDWDMSNKYSYKGIFITKLPCQCQCCHHSEV